MSMKYPYRDLGVPFDRNFRNDLNANFDDIEHDIRMIGGEAAQQALEAAHEAETQAIYAQTSGDYANDKGDYAAQQGDYAKTQGDYAKAQGDYAKAQGDYAKSVADQNKTTWKTPVATYSAIATTYPSPQLGDTVMTLDDGKIYRYDGSTWQFTQQYNSTALNNLANELSKQNKQSAVIGHGLNIINASQNSPLDIQIEGRTLVNVSQNVLDSAKYYVLADKKSKVKFADGTTYTGVAKFQGKAEKPILIRVENFEGKVSGSTVENPHVAKGANSNTSLQPPSSGGFMEFSSGSYTNVYKQDGTNIMPFNSVIANGNIAQVLFSFNLIDAIERNVGKIPASNIAGKVAWLKNNIAKITCNWWGYGQSPAGYKASLTIWRADTSQWKSGDGYWPRTTTSSSVTKLSGGELYANQAVDSNGFVHFIAYADPSDGTTPSTIYTDYVELEIELKPDAQLWNPRFPLYEVDATEYANILTVWDENEVMRRYPMVESVQHVQNPYVIAEGENLLPPFTEWDLHANARMKSPYELELNATAQWQESKYNVPVVTGQSYTLNLISNGFVVIRYLDKNKVKISESGQILNFPFTFTPVAGTAFIQIVFSNSTTGTFTFTNPMLTLGNQSKPFVPRNPSYLFAEVKLGALSDKKDVLWKDGQDWKITKWIEKDVILDGSLAWAFGTDYTGFKSVFINMSGHAYDTAVVVNASQIPLSRIISSGSTPPFTDANQQQLRTTTLAISISDTDSGWGETYMPTQAEIKAYFYGWRMCNGTYGQPYNGTGTKTWYPIGDTDLSRATTTCPTSAAPTISEGKISYYKLSYVRQTPITEVVTDKVEGDLVVNGATQVEVGSGVVVREKAVIAQSGGFYRINDNLYGSQLKNKVLTFLALYKNGIKETIGNSGSYSGWYRDNVNSPYGKEKLVAKSEFYDQTAEYTVTYLVLDRHLFTTNILAVTANYDTSLKSVVDDVVAKQSDIAAQVSVNVRAIAELYKRIKALGG